MGEMLGRHEIIGFNSLLNIFAMDSDSYSHEHVLRAFGHLPIYAEKVRTLQGLEPEIVVVEVLVVNNGRVQFRGMTHHSFVGVGGYHRRRAAVFLHIEVNSLAVRSGGALDVRD